MSSPLALAGVTAVLKALLVDAIQAHDLTPVTPPVVSALPPDRIATGNSEENRINLFLYQVTPNLGWRNQGMPSVGHNGEKLGNPPLALDLHYMLTTYGKSDLTAEVLLGVAMEVFHDVPVLKRAQIRDTLKSTNGSAAPNDIMADAEGRLATDLAEQIEGVKITPKYLSTDELSRLWTSMQARYRPTMAYEVTTVLIQHTRPTKTPLPVLKRGENDSGANSQANVAPPRPRMPGLKSITVMERAGDTLRSTAELGNTLVIDGAALDGTTVTALFQHRLFDDVNPQPIKPENISATQVKFALPDDGLAPDDWPPGIYSVGLKIERAGKKPALTNLLTFSLAPRITSAPTVTGTTTSPQVHVTFSPNVRKKQQVAFFAGSEPFKPDTFPDQASAVDVKLDGITQIDGPIPVVLRIDGVDSILVRDTTAADLEFDPQQTIKLPQ